MRSDHLAYLVCPTCQGEVRVAGITEGTSEQITSGSLSCNACERTYPIIRSVPRFVALDNYASGFGLEWTRHARTQYDSSSRHPLSRRRFFEETRWPRELSGETIIEVGSGSGRFTEQAASTGAMVLSLDYSFAVDANYASNGHRQNVLIVQGDVLSMPFARPAAEKLFCFGVLQHTPHPRQAFLSLPRHLKPGGNLVIDVYRKSFARYVLGTKYWVRPLTRRIPPDRLYRFVQRYIDAAWPVAGVVRRVPKIGPALNWRLLVADYSAWGLKGDALKEWAVLDTFDMLAPRYDFPQTLQRVRRWFEEAELVDVVVARGYNGIEGRGSRPSGGLADATDVRVEDRKQASPVVEA